MKLFTPMLALALIASGMVLIATSAEAQKARNYAWCLETSMGRGGGTMVECRYNTFEQCRISKVAHGDQCYRNPRRR